MDSLTEKLRDRTPDYLIALHIASTGNQAEDAGCDEKPIVMITLKLLNLHQRDLFGDEKQIILSPRKDDQDQNLSQEAQLSLGLVEEDLSDQKSLTEAIEEIDDWLKARGLYHISVHKEGVGSSFQFLLDSYLSFRLVLHSNLTRVNFDDFKKYPYLLEYFEIRKIFSRKYNVDHSTQSLYTMLHFLNMEPPFLPMILMKQLSSWTSTCRMSEFGYDPVKSSEESTPKGLWPLSHCRDLVRLAIKLCDSNENWRLTSFIQEFYTPALIHKTTVIPDDVVVRARGLPWQATDNEIHKFLRGITIAPGGIALVLGKVGRRNGEALIALANIEQRDLALRKHKHHINTRYIEIYTALGPDFIDISGCDTVEAEEFLVNLTNSEQSLIRIRGLPYNVTSQEIVEFFKKSDCHVQFDLNGVLLVKKVDGKSTGDAFVMFETREIANQALLSHRQHIGSRYIEIFKSTPAEVHQVMNSVKVSAQNWPSPVNYILPQSYPPVLPGISDLTQSISMPLLSIDYTKQGPSQFQMAPSSIDSTGILNSPNNLGMFAIKKAYVRLRNIPIEVSINDILHFLDINTQFISLQGNFPMIYKKINEKLNDVIIEVVNEAAALLIFTTKNLTEMFIDLLKKSVTVEVNVSSHGNFDENQYFMPTDPVEQNQNGQHPSMFDQQNNFMNDFVNQPPSTQMPMLLDPYMLDQLNSTINYFISNTQNHVFLPPIQANFPSGYSTSEAYLNANSICNIPQKNPTINYAAINHDESKNSYH